MTELFPPLEYSEWSDTLATVHRFSQVVGKLRLAHSPRRNHWWNVPFHLTGRGPVRGVPAYRQRAAQNPRGVLR